MSFIKDEDILFTRDNEEMIIADTINLGTTDHPCKIPIYKATGKTKEVQDKWIANYNLCREKIREKYPKSKYFVEDIIDCPLCNGNLSFTISDNINGHISASCDSCGMNWGE